MEKTILSSLCGLGTFVKDHMTTRVRVYFWALSFVLLVCISAFRPAPHCFNYYSFVICFEVRKCETFVLPFQDCLAI